MSKIKQYIRRVARSIRRMMRKIIAYIKGSRCFKKRKRRRRKEEKIEPTPVEIEMKTVARKFTPLPEIKEDITIDINDEVKESYEEGGLHHEEFKRYKDFELV